LSLAGLARLFVWIIFTRFSIYNLGVKLINQVGCLFGLPLIASLTQSGAAAA
jgi:hypothetical protein